MSRVVVRPLNTLGGIPPAPPGITGLYFADDFHRADQPFNLGNYWVCWVSGSTEFTGINFANFVNVGGLTQANFRNTTGGGGSMRCMFFGAPLNWNEVNGLAQFAEMRILADTSVPGSVSRIGPCVLGNCNGSVGDPAPGQGIYVLTMFPELGTWVIRRGMSNEVTLTAQFPFAMNDTMRLECDTPTAASTTLRAYRNGALIATVVDADAVHTRTGMPGIGWAFGSAGIISSWDNFKCGILPQVSTLAVFPP